MSREYFQQEAEKKPVQPEAPPIISIGAAHRSKRLQGVEIIVYPAMAVVRSVSDKVHAQAQEPPR